MLPAYEGSPQLFMGSRDVFAWEQEVLFTNATHLKMPLPLKFKKKFYTPFMLGLQSAVKIRSMI
jgi:hypothetical protein